MGIFGGILKKLFWPITFIIYRFVKNESVNGAGDTTHPGASGGDAYKIFNQAETEAQKMVGESAGQPGFECSIRILVASDTRASAHEGLKSLIAANSIFTDEYNNQLDNPQMTEDVFRFLFTPLRYFAYNYRLIGILQDISRFSTDEMTTMYHFPDIKYNKSPIIAWMDYKMLPPPTNLKFPKEPLILSDYKRDAKGNVFTEDGSLLQVDKNKNILRDPQKNFLLLDGTIVPVHTE